MEQLHVLPKDSDFARVSVSLASHAQPSSICEILPCLLS